MGAIEYTGSATSVGLYGPPLLAFGFEQLDGDLRGEPGFILMTASTWRSCAIAGFGVGECGSDVYMVAPIVITTR